jgi:hypothetical protein
MVEGDPMTRAWTIGVAACVLAIGAAGPAAGPQARTVPAGTQFNVLLQTVLNSGTAKAEQRFETAILEDVKAQAAVVLEIGTVVRGFVSSVRPAGKDGASAGQITLSFDELRLGERTLGLRASVVGVLDPRRPDESRRATTASVVGGGSLGLAPLLDVMVNAGGTIVSTSGVDVKLPVGVVLRLRLSQPIDIPAAAR